MNNKLLCHLCEKRVQSEEPELRLSDLYEKANELCMKHWEVEFKGKIEIVNRPWRAYLGMYIPSKQLIRFSRYRNLERSNEQIINTLLHELVHWRLHQQKLPYRDTDTEFILECQRVGCSLSGTKVAQKAAQRLHVEYQSL
ncbi:hypothetical protein IC620_15570 [Hazenella sp. IB182357]|uniref:SprT-like domain-containing protein n=2 Tax=Polycladospora coralii TaxID=2771432 RepID=A0A926NHR7_9BACL|nr:SprT-like domain-containing protein [Polycladospora coralii]MBD1373764.1 hypothetical protein [Polycladospora coralii]